MRRAAGSVVAAVVAALVLAGPSLAAPPVLVAPPGFTATLVATQSGLSVIGFDLAGNLLGGTRSNLVGGCNDTGGSLERINPDGSATTLATGLNAPARIVRGPGGPFGSQLYVVDTNAGLNCEGTVFRYDPPGFTTIARFGSLGEEPRSGAFDPVDGSLWIVEASTGTNAPPDSGYVEHMTSPTGTPSVVATGAPLGDPNDLAFGPGGAYGTGLYVSDIGEERYGGVRSSIERMDAGVHVTTWAQASAANDFFTEIAFAPSGPFGGLLYAGYDPASSAGRVVAVGPSGTMTTFAALQPAAGQFVADVLPTADGGALYVLVLDSALTGYVFRVTPSASRYGSDQLDSSRCGLTKQSRNVVNAGFRLVNDYDSGVHGNAWANDTVHRELRIWRISPTGDTFCATVTDTAKFVTFAGDSPGGSGHVSAGVAGSFVGGEITGQFTGSLVSNPLYPTSGEVGQTLASNTFDLACTDATTCPGARPSISSYVNGWDGRLAWWGWQYTTDGHGVWTDSSDGITGDITG